jgi:hypothetical protein
MIEFRNRDNIVNLVIVFAQGEDIANDAVQVETLLFRLGLGCKI